MAILSKEERAKTVIDLSGSDGNAFALIGVAKKLGRDLGYSKEEITDMVSEMMSGDYEDLITTFDERFGEIVDLQR